MVYEIVKLNIRDVCMAVVAVFADHADAMQERQVREIAVLANGVKKTRVQTSNKFKKEANYE